MDTSKKLRVIFTDKAELIFSRILTDNNIQEPQNLSNFESLKRSPAMMIRQTVIIMARKIIPDQKLSELLQKHLQISKESVEKILQDIKTRLLPLLLVYPEEYFYNPLFRSKISQKVFGAEKQLTDSQMKSAQLKKVEIPDVEKNAEELQRKRIAEIKKNTLGEEIKNKGASDKYREPVE